MKHAYAVRSSGSLRMKTTHGEEVHACAEGRILPKMETTTTKALNSGLAHVALCTVSFMMLATEINKCQ
jgi:hypothetical protein